MRRIACKPLLPFEFLVQAVEQPVEGTGQQIQLVTRSRHRKVLVTVGHRHRARSLRHPRHRQQGPLAKPPPHNRRQHERQHEQKKTAHPRCQAHSWSSSGAAGIFAQQVAAASQGVDQPVAMSLELAPQLLDVHGQRVRIAVVSLGPHMLIDPGTRKHLAAMPQQEDEQ